MEPRLERKKQQSHNTSGKSYEERGQGAALGRVWSEVLASGLRLGAEEGIESEGHPEPKTTPAQ